MNNELTRSLNNYNLYCKNKVKINNIWLRLKINYEIKN